MVNPESFGGAEAEALRLPRRSRAMAANSVWSAYLRQHVLIGFQRLPASQPLVAAAQADERGRGNRTSRGGVRDDLLVERNRALEIPLDGLLVDGGLQLQIGPVLTLRAGQHPEGDSREHQSCESVHGDSPPRDRR